jgi:hypothetical protein
MRVDQVDVLVSTAREGRFLEVLPELLRLTGQEDGDPDAAWEAVAAAVEILAWDDRSEEGAELVENLIRRDGRRGGLLSDQDFPFVGAFHDAELQGGPRAKPRLEAAALMLPEESNLGEALRLSAQDLDQASPAEVIHRAYGWGHPVLPLDDSVIGAELVDRPFGELTQRERGVLWEALQEVNDFPRAQLLHSATGEPPEQYDGCLWMAGWYATEGEISSAEGMLLAAHGRWWPFQTWDAIPAMAVVDPVLRRACTERVREYYLTRPIGPEAAKEQR